MTDPNEKSLLALLQEVSSLPEYMHRDAIRNIIAEWRQKNPLVEEVASGQTTFEIAISALIKENCNLRYFNHKGDPCNSSRFETLATETAARFAGILPLESYRSVGRMITVDDLTSRVDFKKCIQRTFTFNVCIMLLGALLTWLVVSYCGDNRAWALWYWAVFAGICLGAILSIGQLLVGYPMYLSKRKELAQRTLKQAKFLDHTLQAA